MFILLCVSLIMTCNGSPPIKTVPVTPSQPWVINREGDDVLVLMESGTNLRWFHSDSLPNLWTFVA